MRDSIERVGPKEAHEHLEAGNALLVCAYDDPAKWHQNHLEGAISLDDLERRADALPKSTELIFYCA